MLGDQMALNLTKVLHLNKIPTDWSLKMLQKAFKFINIGYYFRCDELTTELNSVFTAFILKYVELYESI